MTNTCFSPMKLNRISPKNTIVPEYPFDPISKKHKLTNLPIYRLTKDFFEILGSLVNKNNWKAGNPCKPLIGTYNRIVEIKSLQRSCSDIICHKNPNLKCSLYFSLNQIFLLFFTAWERNSKILITTRHWCRHFWENDINPLLLAKCHD